uniref:Uncharacterized protein n=1 Tax=Molossus molossus TaxID=27622 RepID=A0A7J8BLH7_MOLMO|nr:hypothetical protein HJG59_010168 [Molossus molossus]
MESIVVCAPEFGTQKALPRVSAATWPCLPSRPPPQTSHLGPRDKAPQVLLFHSPAEYWSLNRELSWEKFQAPLWQGVWGGGGPGMRAGQMVKSNSIPPRSARPGVGFAFPLTRSPRRFSLDQLL